MKRRTAKALGLTPAKALSSYAKKNKEPYVYEFKRPAVRVLER